MSDVLRHVQADRLRVPRGAQPGCFRLLHLSTSDAGGGGARSAYRLHKKLISDEVFSQMLVLEKSTGDSFVRAIELSTKLPRRVVRRFLRARNSIRLKWALHGEPRIPREAFSLSSSPYYREIADQIGTPDLINLHWTAGFVDIRRFFARFGNAVPIVWRPSDMYPFTGGCHYSHSCDRYRQSCGECPYLGSRSPFDLSRSELRRRDAAYRGLDPRRFHVVAQSRWMADVVKASRVWRRFPVTIIPNGVNTEVFRPIDCCESRKALEIPLDGRVVGFVSDDVENVRKGLRQLIQALRQMPASDDVCLLTVGSGSLGSEIEIPLRHLGRIEDDRLLARVYSAMTVFVAPSLQDTFPNTAIEALACGTPVIGARSGGLLDVIRPNETGWFVDPDDETQFGNTMFQAVNLDGPRLEALREECRRAALQEYDVVLQARRYLALYRELVSRSAGQ